MRTRDKKGCYTPHNTPGSGTGLDKLPEKQWHEILKDVNPDAQVGPIHYEHPGQEKVKR